MNTYINVLIGVLIGLIVYNMGFLNIIEGLSNAQQNNCNKMKNTIYQNNADVLNMQKKIKSLQNWQGSIVKTVKLNTKRNEVNRNNIKRTTEVVKQGVKDKEKEMDNAAEWTTIQRDKVNNWLSLDANQYIITINTISLTGKAFN